MAWLGTIVQQPVRTEVVPEVDFWKQVTVQIRDANRQSPTAGDFLAKDIFLFDELHGGRFAAFAALPEENMFIAAIEGFGFAFVHDFDASRFRIEDMAAILEVVSD